MALALQMYAGDYDNTFPFTSLETLNSSAVPPGGVWSSGSTGPYYFWQQLIYPYMGNVGLATCPDNPLGKQTVDMTWLCNYSANGTSSMTANNYAVMGVWYEDPVHAMYCTPSATEAQLTSPSQTYAVFDGGGNATLSAWHCLPNTAAMVGYLTTDAPQYVPGTGGMIDGGSDLTPTMISQDAFGAGANVAKDFYTGRHAKNNNVAFCDGHAKVVSAGKMVAEANAAGINSMYAWDNTTSAWLPQNTEGTLQ